MSSQPLDSPPPTTFTNIENSIAAWSTILRVCYAQLQNLKKEEISFMIESYLPRLFPTKFLRNLSTSQCVDVVFEICALVDKNDYDNPKKLQSVLKKFFYHYHHLHELTMNNDSMRRIFYSQETDNSSSSMIKINIDDDIKPNTNVKSPPAAVIDKKKEFKSTSPFQYLANMSKENIMNAVHDVVQTEFIDREVHNFANEVGHHLTRSTIITSVLVCFCTSICGIPIFICLAFIGLGISLEYNLLDRMLLFGTCWFIGVGTVTIIFWAFITYQESLSNLISDVQESPEEHMSKMTKIMKRLGCITLSLLILVWFIFAAAVHSINIT